MPASVSLSSLQHLRAAQPSQADDADFAIDDASSLMLRTLDSLSKHSNRPDEAAAALWREAACIDNLTLDTQLTTLVASIRDDRADAQFELQHKTAPDNVDESFIKAGSGLLGVLNTIHAAMTDANEQAGRFDDRLDVFAVDLDSAASAQKPKRVLDVMMKAYTEDYSNVHRGLHFLSNASTQAFEDARESVRRFINAPSAEQIIFTRNATEAINLVAQSFGGMGGAQNPAAAMGMLQIPAMRSMMAQMFQNPGFLDSVAASNPQLRTMLDSNPMVRWWWWRWCVCVVEKGEGHTCIWRDGTL